MDRLLGEQKNDEEKRQSAKTLNVELVEIDARDFKTFKKNYRLVSIVESILNKIKSKLG
jgi:indole-3-glycerol phosphate synthase